MGMRNIEEQTIALASRTYWDVFGAEAESLSLEQKIQNLGIFVQEGGNIAEVVNRYAESTDDESRLNALQWAIFYYLEYMINARESLAPYQYEPTALRIMRLNKEELLELLQKELQRCVIIDYNGSYVITGVNEINDHNLDAIERRHWRENPEESFTSYTNRTRFWDKRIPGLWSREYK